jgi:hypothetical protein
VLGRVCRAVGQVIEHLPGPIRRAADLQRVLGVDRALGWQLFRVGTGDPIEAGPHVPRPAPLNKALLAAARRAVPASIIEEARQAAAEFESLVDRHAGDRGAFDAMARGLAADNDGQVHLKDRRAAFRANSNIWGLNALASYSCLVFHDSQAAGKEDSVLVVGHVGVQKIRPAIRMSLGYQWGVYRSEQVGGPRVRISAQREVAFLEAYSASPLPNMTTREIEPGLMEASLELGAVGRSGAVTYFARHIAREASDHTAPSWWGGNMTCRVPAEVMVQDVLIPVGWSDPSTASATAFGNLQDIRRLVARDPGDRLPCACEMVCLGQDLARLHTPAVARCPDMIADAIRSMEWEGTRFDIFRCVVEYPVLHTSVATRVDSANP